MFRRKIILFALLALFTVFIYVDSSLVAKARTWPYIEKRRTVDAFGPGGEELKIVVSSHAGPTDLEGRLRDSSAFYFLKLKYKGNYFSFNIPGEHYEDLTDEQITRLVAYLLDLYERAFEVFASMSTFIPERYRFNVTFGRTASGHTFNNIYVFSKVSNIFTDFVPYGEGNEVMTDYQRGIVFHEIGHSLFGIAIGNLCSARTRAVEEGVVDYITWVEFGEKPGIGYSEKFVISSEKADAITGLAQLDVDASIWGTDAVMKGSGMKGYLGFTHHSFGFEFINAFIEVFGKQALFEFLMRLKAVEERVPEDDLGTAQIKGILQKMGYPPEEIQSFENELHRRLKANVFAVRE